MSGDYKSELRASIRYQLKDIDPSDETWIDKEIDSAMDRAMRDINRREPELRHTLLAVQDLSKSIDISSLTDFIKIISVEWPFGEVPPALRSFRVIGDAVVMEISSVVDTDQDTLTGTVTFTNGSFSVSGSGTAFTTELSAGCYIKKSTGSYWYRIAYVSSDTALVLDTPFDETTGADTEDATISRTKNDCAMVNWTRRYPFSDEYDEPLPQKVEDLIVLGSMAHLLAAQATKEAAGIPIGANTVSTYAGQADRYMALYQAGLSGLGRIEDTMVASYPIT